MIEIIDTNDSRAVRNKNNVLGLYDLMINKKKSEEATAKFVSPAYIQHNPLIADGSVALGKFFRENGLYTLVRWNTFYTNPPLCINEQQLREAFAIIDRGLEITDRAVKE